MVERNTFLRDANVVQQVARQFPCRIEFKARFPAVDVEGKIVSVARTLIARHRVAILLDVFVQPPVEHETSTEAVGVVVAFGQSPRVSYVHDVVPEPRQGPRGEVHVVKLSNVCQTAHHLPNTRPAFYVSRMRRADGSSRRGGRVFGVATESHRREDGLSGVTVCFETS